MERNGIIAAGNLICDRIRLIDAWPGEGMLATILHEEKSTGGSSCNVLLDLARLDSGIPLYACGVLGDDSDGRFVRDSLEKYGIDTSHIDLRKGLGSSYTDVMTVKGTGRRTFFHFRGANGNLDIEDLEKLDVPARIVHLGYLLLLDRLDAEDPKYGVRAARALRTLQAAGYETSVDVVSEESYRFQKIVLPCLPYIDYLVLNEIEAGKCIGKELRDSENRLNEEKIPFAADRLLAGGVSKAVIVHFPEGAFGINRSGEMVFVPSFHIEEREIAGTAGAGDAFCSGVLYGLHSGFSLRRCLQLGNASAWFVLKDTTCSRSAAELTEIEELIAEQPSSNSEHCRWLLEKFR